MRNITKGREPASLTEHRQTSFADYDNYRDKDALRTGLVSEQRGICCYCMQQIHPVEGSMKIEHWHSQQDFSGEQLTYSNLLASCMGGDGQPEAVKHCDTAKGNRVLSRNPADPDHHVEELIHYWSNGRIASTNATLDAELNNVLNLNVSLLCNGRLSVLRALQKALRMRGTFTKRQWERLLEEWSGTSHTNNLRPFCGVIVYWIRKKLTRA
jgi:uncharacterized protein (TIGR02646 family)